jgi:hypothetical protein
MSGLLRGLMMVAAGASMVLTGCAKKQDAEVRVSVSDSGSGSTVHDTVVNNTTIVQPVPTTPDTIVRNNTNTVIEHRTDTVVKTVPGRSVELPTVTREEQGQIDKWIAANSLNEFGDPAGTSYTGGTPLFDEKTGTPIDRYSYIVLKHPDRPWSSMK